MLKKKIDAPTIAPKNSHRLNMACALTNRAGQLKLSKNISAAFSRFLRGLSGASVNRTGCSSGLIFNWEYTWRENVSTILKKEDDLLNDPQPD